LRRFVPLKTRLTFGSASRSMLTRAEGGGTMRGSSFFVSWSLMTHCSSTKFTGHVRSIVSNRIRFNVTCPVVPIPWRKLFAPGAPICQSATCANGYTATC
jgi:hypothetical protein